MDVSIERGGVTPLYYQLGEQLKRRIESGALRPEAQLPPEDVFAAELGVSRKTLRLSLDKLSKEGYVNRRKGRGTFVSAAYSRHRVLVVVVENNMLGGGHWSIDALLGGILNKACASGVELRAIPVNQTPRLVESYGAGQSDLLGMLFLRYVDAMAPALELANKAGISTMLEGATVPGENYVDLDNEEPMRQAVAYLADLGHRRIGLLTPLAASLHHQRRMAAARRAIADLGLEFQERWLLQLTKPYVREVERAECGEFLKQQDLPTALVAGSDHSAIAFIQEAKSLGFQLPKDFSITGFDDIPNIDVLEPPLTTFKQDYSRQGAIAATALIELSTDFNNKKRQIVITPELIVRGSCAKPK